jgi:hypothetical protein
MSIVLISELVDHRARKATELKFYSDQKAVLEMRLAIIQGELKLTDKILAMIRKEQIVEVQA